MGTSMEETENFKNKQFRLLVVEDDSTLLQLIEKKLPGEDMMIETANDGAAAIDAIRSNPPDLLLLDYLLSDMDGSRLIEYVRGKGLEIPFIIMTGFGDEKVAVNLMKLGAQDYIIKDPNFMSLLPVVVRQAKENIKTREKLAEAQKALNESEYNYRILVESSRDLIFTTDLNGRFLFANSNFESMTGYTKEELVGKSFIDVVETDFLEIIQEKFVSGLTGKEIPFFQVNFHSKNGKIIPLELNITVIYDNGNLKKGMLGVGRDVSHRRKYEETLKQNEEYFRTLIQNSSDAIIILNGNGTFRFISNSFEQIIGYRPDELEFMKFFDVIHQKDIVKALNFFWEVVQNSDQDSTFEIRFIHKDGSSRYVEGIGRNMMNNTTVNGIYINIRDLEMRKRLEEQLVNAQKMEAVGRLAGGIAHDFNNIMTAIINYSEVIIKSFPGNDNLFGIVMKIIKSAKEAASYTTQLLAFSSKQMFMPKVLDINDLLENMKLKLSRSLPEYIGLDYELQQSVVKVNIDKTQVEMVVRNLVTNAVEAIERIKDIIIKGSIVIKTEFVNLTEEDCKDIKDAYPGGFIRLSIADNGIGIDGESISHMFEPFYSTKTEDKGAGLGLAVVYGIVRQHRGWIEVKSRVNEGTLFSVFVPVHVEKTASSKKAADLMKEYKGNGQRILLIEDEENVRKLAVQSLRSHGYVVFPAVDAGQALDIFNAEDGNFDLIFTDVALPDKTGIDFLNDVINDDRIGIILTSGYFDEDSALKTFSNRNYKFIAKPYDVETLLKYISEILILRK